MERHSPAVAQHRSFTPLRWGMRRSVAIMRLVRTFLRPRRRRSLRRTKRTLQIVIGGQRRRLAQQRNSDAAVAGKGGVVGKHRLAVGAPGHFVYAFGWHALGHEN